VRWIVTLSASGRDAERLAAESLPGLSAAGDDPRELLLELDDLGSDVPDEDAPQAAKAVRASSFFGGYAVSG
jgi:hypothetical protein